MANNMPFTSITSKIYCGKFLMCFVWQANIELAMVKNSENTAIRIFFAAVRKFKHTLMLLKRNSNFF